MKLNGKIQIVGGNPGENKVLTCINNDGNCEWLEIPNSGDDNFLDTGQLKDSTLILTTTNGNTIEIDLSSLNSGEPVNGRDGVGIMNTTDNGDGTFTFNYTNKTSFTTSDLTGPKGDQGEPGTNGSGTDTYVNSVEVGSDTQNKGEHLIIGRNDGQNYSIPLNSLFTDTSVISGSLDNGAAGELYLNLTKSTGGVITIDVTSLNGGGTDTYVVSGAYDMRSKSINLTLNDNSIVSIPFSPVDNNNFIISGRIDGNNLILTDNFGNDTATIDISTLNGGDDKYLNNVTLPTDGANANQLTLTLNDNSSLSVDVSHLVNDNNTALRKFGKDKVTNNVTITTTSNSQTVRVVHDLGRFYPVFTVYHVNRDKVILPESVGMVNSTGMIPANAVTGPHELNELDMTFTEPGTYIISFVG